MRTFSGFLFAFALTFVLAWSAPARPGDPKQAPSPAAPNSKAPINRPAPTTDPATLVGLKVGEVAPEARLAEPGGETVDLERLIADGPVVLVFYRGGWCPFCTKALDAWQGALPDITGSGGSLIAVTPEKAEFAEGLMTEKKLGFKILSDSDGSAARAFKILFALDPAMQEKYKGYGVDLSRRNWDGSWNLPIPATFVIDRDGTIRFAHVNPDYKVRADPAEVVRVLNELRTEREKAGEDRKPASR